MAATRARLAGAVGARLPRGMVLPEGEWRSRHRLLLVVLAAHLPVIIAVGIARYEQPLAIAAEAAAIAVIALAAVPGRSRLRRSLLVTLGLMASGAVLVQLSNGRVEANAHLFVVLILIALYQDWRPFAAGFGFLVVEYVGFALWVHSGTSVARPGSGVLLAVVHGGYLIAAGLALMVFWSYSERLHRREESYRRQLLDAEMGALARMREAGQIREDLIASVSHEFRTPLTAIRGAAATLRARGDQVPPDVRARLLQGIVEHGARLSNLLEDMLSAASAAALDPAAVADVTAAMDRLRGRAGLVVGADRGLAAYIDRATLDQLLGALADYGHLHGRGEDPVELAARADGSAVLVALRFRSDSGHGEDPRRLLEPFGSRESAATGRPASLGLYLARRLAEVYGGDAVAQVDGDLVMVRIRLRALRTSEPRRADADRRDEAEPVSEVRLPGPVPGGVGRR